VKPAVPYRPPGDVDVRRDRWTVLVAFWCAFALVCVGAVAVVLIREPEPTPPSCRPPQQCPGPPPVIPPSALRTWANTELGVVLRYPVRVFTVVEAEARSLRLRVRARRAEGVEATLWISVQPARHTLPEELLATREDELSGSILGLTPDEDPQTIIPPPQIGLVGAVGGSYRGTADTAQGPTSPVVAILAAATNGHTGVVFSYVVTGTDDSPEIARLRAYLSPVLTSVTWKP